MKNPLARLPVSAFALTGSNPIAEAGKNIERGGEKVRDTARKIQHDL